MQKMTAFQIPAHFESVFYVVKRNKRLCIIDGEGEQIYSPPDFIHLQGRERLHRLARDLEVMPYIDAVMQFECAD